MGKHDEKANLSQSERMKEYWRQKKAAEEKRDDKPENVIAAARQAIGRTELTDRPVEPAPEPPIPLNIQAPGRFYFRSKYLSRLISMVHREPVYEYKLGRRRKIQDGAVTVIAFQPYREEVWNNVEGANELTAVYSYGHYETDDPKVAGFIRGHDGFGSKELYEVTP